MDDTANRTWFDDHRGELLRTEGMVWACGDDECGCTRPEIVKVYRNKVTRNSVVFESVWAGEFRTDHEPGAAAELAAKRAELALTDQTLHDSILWQD